MAAARERRKRLGEILVAHGVLSESELEDALAAQAAADRRERLGNTIVRLEMATEEDIAEALATQLGYETVDLATVGPEDVALSRVPRKLAERHRALPLEIDEHDNLIVAMADPTNIVALDDLRLTSGLRGVKPVVSTETAVHEALRRAYGSDTQALDMVESLSGTDVVSIDEDKDADLEDLAAAAREAEDQPIIRLANAILADAVRSRTSDVHIEPEREHVRVRYRIDGMLRETMRIPKRIGPALVSRLKIMATMDIAERRRPQDGRAMIRVEGQEVDLRVSSMPTMHGETLVLRLLRKGAQRLKIGDLGMPNDVRRYFEIALNRPQGLVLITGPTGSGKTTTLYAGLAEITDEVRNIITLEDPIEYQLSGVNQTQVAPKIGLTFASGLRTVLRQDPDVVMVGEIRDRETAELALEASMTGHLVLSTLHTNDAPSTIVRLRELDVDQFMLASSLLMVSAQRLARVVCPHCKAPHVPEDRFFELLGIEKDKVDLDGLVHGEGCNVCERTGFLGRIGLMEVLRVTPELRELIMRGASEVEIARHAREEGMRTLREDGLAKAFAGITSLEEVLRTTPDEAVRFSLEEAAIDPSIVEGVAPVDPRLTSEVRPLLPDDEEQSEAAGQDGPADEDDDAEPPTVLVVDDDPSIRQLLGVLLEEKYLVIEAEDAEGAMSLTAKQEPDAVILDYKLPDRNGIEVTELLRARDGNGMPILMITGVEDPGLEADGLIAGVDDFLTKPFDEDVLLARLRAALRRSGRRS